MTVSAKICGLSTAATLDAAVAGRASHVGFVFFPPSPRTLRLADAAALAARVPDGIQRVGVFVDPDDALLDEAIVAGRLAAVQLHSNDPARLGRLGPRLRQRGVELWAAVAVRGPADLAAASRLAALDIARIVFDAKTPDDALLPGGMGLRFDWTMLGTYRHAGDWVLAGGLSADTVAEAVRITGARLVDVSSGVESEPGVKDPERIAAFLRTVAAL